MVRLHALVEGQTEESFVNEILAPELQVYSVFVDARCVATGRRHGRKQKGGAANFARVRRELVRWMKEDRGPDSWFTSMFDLYRLDSGFPGFEDCATHTEALQRVKCIETAFADDIDQEFGKEGISRRFIPYIQLHEFESLVFADPEALLTVRPNQEDAIKQLLEIKQAAGGAELVNGGHETTPSKRLLNLIPDYAKTVDGILTIKHIGFPKLKSQCPHFACWTERLLAAAATQKPQ